MAGASAISKASLQSAFQKRSLDITLQKRPYDEGKSHSPVDQLDWDPVKGDKPLKPWQRRAAIVYSIRFFLAAAGAAVMATKFLAAGGSATHVPVLTVYLAIVCVLTGIGVKIIINAISKHH